jgi:hypothetical protein
MKRGGSVVSKEACRTAEKASDYCEPDRASEVMRDGVRLPYAPLKALQIKVCKVFLCSIFQKHSMQILLFVVCVFHDAVCC